MAKLIELRDVYKIYGEGLESEVRALDGVSLDIEKGEFVAVVGQSGSGKSTMMNVLGCLDIPTRGTYRLDGVDVRELTDKELSRIRNKQIGFIFQQYNLIQNLPLLRVSSRQNLTAKGGCVISDVAKGSRRQATIIATGSEVSIAVEAQKKLREEGIEVAVVSMPCTELFDRQDEKYRNRVLGRAPRIVVEAAAKFGWEKYLGSKGEIIGMDGFGA